MKVRYLFAILIFVFLSMAVSCRNAGMADADIAASEARESAIRFSDDVRRTGRLQLSRAEIKKVGTIDDILPSQAITAGQRARVMLNTVKVGRRIAVYSFRTYVSASVDLSVLPSGSIVIDTLARTCRIMLPAPEIAIDGRDVSLTEEHHRVSGLRSEIRSEERAELKEQMSAAVLKEIESDTRLHERLRTSAENKARQFFQTLAMRHGLTATVEFIN